MQEIKLIERNFNVFPKSLKEVTVYETVPEKLLDFQNRINAYLKEGYCYIGVFSEQINNATIPTIILIRDV